MFPLVSHTLPTLPYPPLSFNAKSAFFLVTEFVSPSIRLAATPFVLNADRFAVRFYVLLCCLVGCFDLFHCYADCFIRRTTGTSCRITSRTSSRRGR